MERSDKSPNPWWALVFSTVMAGCATVRPGVTFSPLPTLPETAASPNACPLATPLVQRASFETVTPEATMPCTASPDDTPFAGAEELSVDTLVEQVLARNPSLAQMTAAWQAASARYPQVISLDDPMLGTTVAPASIASDNVDFAARVEVSQKLPFPGKRGLRGRSALAEAAAAGNDVEDMRLQLAESAKSSFYEYYLVSRALAVNEESLGLLKEFREQASARYEKALVPEQDVWQADVELARQQERALTLNRMRKVAVARINTLMHLPPDAPLPPPPEQLTLGDRVAPAHELRARAVAQRPDLQALVNRIVAEEASLRLAHKEFGPDFEIMAAYDGFWQAPQQALQGQVGVRLNLPVQKARRFAAIAEAQARVAERRAQLDSRIDQVNLQLQESYEQVVESEQVVRLYEKTTLPAARSNVGAARSAYEAGKAPFLSLVEAQRSRVSLLDRYYEALADYFRRRATLERVVGGPLSPAPSPK
jgi:outer membrane protein, heavy metal efflux system